jgi:hypothetical protein
LSPASPLPLHEADRAALETIVQHWLRFPRASDEAEGIGRFWLGDPALGAQRAERALAVLERASLVRRQSGPDGRVRWSRRAGRSDSDWLLWLGALA